MLNKLLVFTEGSPEIGLGHLVECHSIVDSWKNERCLEKTFFIINKDNGAIRYLNSKNIKYMPARDPFIPSSEFVKSFDAILVNKKHVEYEFLKSLTNFNKKLIVIDELGGKKITSDVLINFSINTKRHNYIFPDKKPETLFGPEYFPAGKAVFDALKIPKPTKRDTILVSLGGYDNSRTINKVLKVLKKCIEFRKEVILGVGFRKDAQFDILLESLDDTFNFYDNVADMPQRIRKSRILINSGGNTLYEAMIVGTPVLVIGEDIHEIEQGSLFEEKGYQVINITEGKKAGLRQIQYELGKLISNKYETCKRISLKDWYQYV